MAWRGSFSRSFNSTARASAFRSPPPLSSARRVRPSSLQPRRLSFSNPREEWKRWVMSAALPGKQWQDSDTELYLKHIVGSTEWVLKDRILAKETVEK